MVELKDGRPMLRLHSAQVRLHSAQALEGISLSAYILCGGKSSRMGEEKGLVEFRGKTFVQWILEAVFAFVDKPVLVTQNSAYRQFGLELIPDRIADQGPVGGIFTALGHSDTAQVLILSCDIPQISTEALDLLLAESQKYPEKISFLSDGKNDYPLIAVYPKSCLLAFAEAVAENRLKLRRLVEGLPYQRIPIQPEGVSSLQNINTKAELNTLSNPY